MANPSDIFRKFCQPDIPAIDFSSADWYNALVKVFWESME
jgi:hypothetical protein